MSTPRRTSLRALLLALAALIFVAPAAAQEPASWRAGSLQPTRAALEAALQRSEASAASPSASAPARARDRDEAERIRRRLHDGDFQTGDQVQLVVEGEEALSSTFTVAPGPRLLLPTVGEVPLRGVLRAELNEHLRGQLARVLRDPVVQSRSLVRVGLMGEVRTPGFYLLPVDALLSDALMAAGGPLPEAELARMRVERGSDRVWEGAAMQQALTDGRTLDELNLRAGDNIVVPEEGSRAGALLRAATVIPGAVLAVIGVIQLL